MDRPNGGRITEDTRLGALLRDDTARAVLLRHAPMLAGSPYLQSIKGMSLRNLAEHSSEDWLAPLLEELRDVSLARPPDHRDSVDPAYEPITTARGSAAVRVAGSVPCWGALELELVGPSHGNPFTDVALSATFDDGVHSCIVPGFYDGDGVYRVRFMPEREGTWSFITTSNARSLDGIEGSFICEPPMEGRHGPVRVTDTFHFEHADGRHYVPIGTTCYAWTHQGDELEEQTLSTLANSAFNKVRMCVFPKAFVFNENEPGLYPFEGTPPTDWDETRPNPAFFRHLEQRVLQLQDLGIEADIILFHPYDRWGFSEMSPAADERYLRYVTARLGAFANVWWSLANEWDLVWSKSVDDWERCAHIIGEQDPYGHLLSIHNCIEFYDHTQPWVTHCSVQRIDSYRTAENTTEWRDRWNKPIVIDECAYEGNIDTGWGNITGEELVRRCWEAAMRGGYAGHGETYVHPDDILWWSKGGVLHGSSPPRIGFLRHFMEAEPARGWEPSRSEWDAPAATQGDETLWFYFGFNQPKFRHFHLPAGIAYVADIIDTWNMTIDRLADRVMGSFRLDLPGRQYIAVRLTPAHQV